MNTNLKMLTVLVVGVLLLGLSGVAAHGGGLVEISFEEATFSNPTVINNEYWPLPEGTTFVYHSLSKDGCQVNDVEVTDVTLMIDGIMTRQVHDVVYEDDDCDGDRDFRSEDTLDWYAQDDEGNVWYLGEDTAEYCDRDNPDFICSTEGSWTAGVDGDPGIVMLAPDAITPGAFYQQEYAEDAQDMAKVLRINARVVLTFENNIDPDEYEGCLKTKEWSPLERGAIEHKYYCPNEGLLLINELQSGTVRTELFEVITSP